MKIRSIVLFSMLAFIGCAKKEGNLHISGNINGLNKGTVYIRQQQDSALVLLDSIEISGDSKFASTLQIESPEMLYMFLDRGVSNSIDNSLPFFAEPGTIIIDTDLETFYAKAKVSGSKNHDLYEDFKKVKTRYTNQELEFTEKELQAFKNNATVSAEDEAKYGAIVKKRYLYAINFALNNKDREIAPYIALAEIPDANVKYLDTIAKSMSPNVAKSKYGKMLTKFVADRKAEPQQ